MYISRRALVMPPMIIVGLCLLGAAVYFAFNYPYYSVTPNAHVTGGGKEAHPAKR